MKCLKNSLKLVVLRVLVIFFKKLIPFSLITLEYVEFENGKFKVKYGAEKFNNRDITFGWMGDRPSAAKLCGIEGENVDKEQILNELYLVLFILKEKIKMKILNLKMLYCSVLYLKPI